MNKDTKKVHKIAELTDHITCHNDEGNSSHISFMIGDKEHKLKVYRESLFFVYVVHCGVKYYLH